MTNTRSKWEKDYDFLTKTTDEPIVLENIKAFIHSTLQEYAREVERGIGENKHVDGHINIITHPTEAMVDVVKMAENKLKDKYRQVLHKLNTTYGLKGEKCRLS